MRFDSGAIKRWGARLRNPSCLLLLVLILGLFHLSPWQRMLESGFDSADDAYFSLIAKQFAVWGLYGLPISWNDIRSFDPGIGSGPGLIIPLALFNTALGPGANHPAVVVILIFLVQIILLTLILYKKYDPYRATLYIASAIFIVSFFKTNYDIFGIVMGEPTMFGFLLLAIAILSGESRSSNARIIGGFCLSAAILTKQSAIFPAFGTAAMVSLLDARAAGRQAIRPILILLIATSLPVLIFEGCKLASLGVAGYFENMAAVAAIQETFRVASPGLNTALRQLAESYSVGTATLCLAVASSIFVLASAPRRLGADKRIAILLISSILCAVLYFALSGFENPRYLWSAAMTIAFLIPLPILTAAWPAQLATIAAILLVVGTPLQFLQLSIGGIPEYNRGVTQERSKVVNFIEQRPDLPVYGVSWHSSFDVFYFLPPDREWHVSPDAEDIGKVDAIYVFFNRFTDMIGEPYRASRDRCDRQLPELTRFEVYVCQAGTTKGPKKLPNPM